MKKKIKLIESGISLVDNAWGGFYRGGTYFLIGARKSGRTLLALQYAMECAKQKETCLFFTSMRPKDLMIQAASIDFDLQYYMNQNLIIVVRVAPPAELNEVPDPDSFLVEYLNDIVTVVDQYQPNKIVFDELTPFIGFNNLNLLENTFSATSERIEDEGITTLYILGEPATPPAQAVVDTLAAYSTGVIYLKKNETPAEDASLGRMIITPNIGHTEGKFSASYVIEPYKGVVTDFMQFKEKKQQSYTTVTRNHRNWKYTSLADIDVPTDNLTSASYYNINDFSLILNNQIALYKSTGQVFTLISFRLDPEAERMGLLTLSQLQNAVRLSSDKKDKICILQNKVIILITRDDPKVVNSIIGKIKTNLPGNDTQYVKNVTRYISVYSVKVDDSVQNANDLFTAITADEPEEENKQGF